MRGSLKNRGFIPNSFIRKQNEIKSKGERRGIFILILINIVLFPIVISSLQGDTLKEEKNSHVEVKKVSLLKNEAIKCLEMDKYDLEGEFIDKSGIIIVNDMDVIREIENDKGIFINSIENLGENKYKLKVKIGV